MIFNKKLLSLCLMLNFLMPVQQLYTSDDGIDCDAICGIFDACGQCLNTCDADTCNGITNCCSSIDCSCCNDSCNSGNNGSGGTDVFIFYSGGSSNSGCDCCCCCCDEREKPAKTQQHAVVDAHPVTTRYALPVSVEMTRPQQSTIVYRPAAQDQYHTQLAHETKEDEILGASAVDVRISERLSQHDLELQLRQATEAHDFARVRVLCSRLEELQRSRPIVAYAVPVSVEQSMPQPPLAQFEGLSRVPLKIKLYDAIKINDFDTMLALSIQLKNMQEVQERTEAGHMHEIHIVDTTPFENYSYQHLKDELNKALMQENYYTVQALVMLLKAKK